MTDTAPRTAAGRALYEDYPGIWFWQDPRWEGPLGLAIEAEAAVLDVDRLARALDAVDSHAYLADEADRCLACGVTGSYGHTGEYRAAVIARAYREDSDD